MMVMSAPGDHLAGGEGHGRRALALRGQRPARRPAQQLLCSELEPAATDHVAGQVALRGERLEVLGRHRAHVADRLAGEPLLRVDAGAVVQVLGPHGAVRAQDAAA